MKSHSIVRTIQINWVEDVQDEVHELVNEIISNDVTYEKVTDNILFTNLDLHTEPDHRMILDTIHHQTTKVISGNTVILPDLEDHKEIVRQLRRQFSISLEIVRDMMEKDKMNILSQFSNYPIQIRRVHYDSGANCSLTDRRELLLYYEDIIGGHPIGGASKGDGSIRATGKGYFPLFTKENYFIPVPMFYYQDSDGTIVSMTATCWLNSDWFHRWTQEVDIFNGASTIRFHGNRVATFECKLQNDLVYYDNTSYSSSIIRQLTIPQKFEIWHQRLGHPGKRVMNNIHLAVNGIPRLHGNAFYKCVSCMLGKMTKTITNIHSNTKIEVHIDDMSDPVINDMLDATKYKRGQMLYCDFGFVRGSDYEDKTKSTLSTSIDGFNCYFLIIDQHTRYITVFLRKDKSPAVEEFRKYVDCYGCHDKSIPKYIRMDQGGELYRSNLFKETVAELNYIIQPTGADSSSQNGMAENPNRVFANMIRCLLHSAGMSSKFWNYALLHAVYLKNRMPHKTLGNTTTPYEMISKKKPDLSHLRVFGCRVYVRKPGKRKYKLDLNYYRGVFLGYTATADNIYYYDIDSDNIKIAKHVTYDEAGMTLSKMDLSPGVHALQMVGYTTSKLPQATSTGDIRLNGCNIITARWNKFTCIITYYISKIRISRRTEK